MLTQNRLGVRMGAQKPAINAGRERLHAIIDGPIARDAKRGERLVYTQHQHQELESRQQVNQVQDY